MSKNKNEVWAFFASVKLALFTFFILAITSIIGTVIPQGKEMDFYVQTFGAGTAKLFQILNVPDMYNAWWFVSLLVVFSINLMVCTIDRFPNIWRLVTMDNLAMNPDRIVKMPKRQTYFAEKSVDDLDREVMETMGSTSWKFESADKDGGKLYSAQKGNWSRLGVIAVHISILVIFAGAIIGSALGFKASVMITEGRSAQAVYARDGKNTPIPLGFELRCDRFQLDMYENGAPKEFTSDLVVLKDGKEVLSKSIEVNDPLQYGGLTFYQSSYNAFENTYVIDLENGTTNVGKKFVVGPGREVKWPEEGLSFGITQIMGSGMPGTSRHKIWFNDEKANPSQFWMNEGRPVIVERPGVNYEMSIRQLYATGLQVAKDPGVWWVYIGCGMMLIGLYVAFFLSHRKVWLYISSEGERARLHISGTSNKNKLGFDKDFSVLTDLLENNESLKLTKE